MKKEPLPVGRGFIFNKRCEIEGKRQEFIIECIGLCSLIACLKGVYGVVFMQNILSFR
jgi:hypothetical protein